MPEPDDQPTAATIVSAESDVDLPSLPLVLEDLTRAVSRQQATIDRLTDRIGQMQARERAAADVPLLVDLLAILGDAGACTRTAESERERAAFAALAAGIERLIVGRGATVIAPAAGSEFSAATMEAAEVIPTDDAAQDHTVDRVVAEGLRLTESGRSIRPALVVVRRYRQS